MELDLVNGWHNLGAWIIEQLLEVCDAEVGDTNGLHLAGLGELLHFLPGLDEVPVFEVLAGVFWVGGRWPVFERLATLR